MHSFIQSFIHSFIYSSIEWFIHKILHDLLIFPFIYFYSNNTAMHSSFIIYPSFIACVTVHPNRSLPIPQYVWHCVSPTLWNTGSPGVWREARGLKDILSPSCVFARTTERIDEQTMVLERAKQVLLKIKEDRTKNKQTKVPFIEMRPIFGARSKLRLPDVRMDQFSPNICLPRGPGPSWISKKAWHLKKLKCIRQLRHALTIDSVFLVRFFIVVTFSVRFVLRLMWRFQKSSKLQHRRHYGKRFPQTICPDNDREIFWHHHVCLVRRVEPCHDNFEISICKFHCWNINK